MDNSTTIPTDLKKLVVNFQDKLSEIKSPNYREARLRTDFLDELFRILGWDLSNAKGLSEKYREVIIEESIDVEGFNKTPDYAFCLGGKKKFFVEAKKPAENLETNKIHAYQLRRYGWSAKLPICLLTDFEEFAIYDCRVKPNEDDSVTVARILYFKIDQLEEYWDQFINLFSKEAVKDGLLDKYIESEKSKRGTLEVNDAFLEDIDEWRKNLAKNLAKNNTSLTQYDLNLAVQLIINRIIFLRICEDRGIEDYGRLQTLDNGTNVYKRLVEFFERADDKYNSGLFHFREENERTSNPDNITPNLAVDDEILRKIFNKLYFPKSPYVFSEIPADILGQVYEQFLGKIISLDTKHNAIVEEKPEVRKAGGVYYTPTYIVEYIVKNTVGKLIENKSPNQVSKIKILDPACGSGSFLIEAYQYLLDWHSDYYLKTGGPSEKLYKGKNPILYQTDRGDWKLTTDERKRILINNIFGVDIDQQAVEMTKLSLLLKVLEGENEQSINKTIRMFHERVLPDLGNNIKCGNSLIENDFYSYDQQTFFDLEDKIKVNAFNWEGEFSQILNNEGFDAIIGNPPYIRIQSLQENNPRQAEYLKKHYKSASKGNYDIYVVFLEKSFSLLKKSGLLGFILPHKFFQAKFAEPIRELLTINKAVREIVHFGAEQVFNSATTYTCLLFLSKKIAKDFRFIKVSKIENPPVLMADIAENIKNKNYSENLQQLNDSSAWNFYSDNRERALKIIRHQSHTLGDITKKIFQGIATSADNIYVLPVIREKAESFVCLSKSLNREIELEKNFVKPFLMGKDVHRYEISEYKQVVIFPYLIDNPPQLMSPKYISDNFPMGWTYLQKNKQALSDRERGKMHGDNFYAYIYPKNLRDFNQIKIITPEIANNCQMTIDERGQLYHTTKVYSFVFKIDDDLRYILGILNSKVLWFFLQSTGYILRGGFYVFKTEYLKPFPIPCSISEKPPSKEQYNEMIDLVNRMLRFHKNLTEEGNTQAKELLLRQIAAQENEINKLAYDIYGLTNEEIKIIEENND